MQRRQFLQTMLAGGLLATSPTWATGRKPPVITVIVKSLQNQYFSLMLDGARQHQLQHAGRYRLNLLGTQNELDVHSQATMVQQAMARRDDALIVAPADSVTLIPDLLKAMATPMLVVNLDNKLDERALARSNVNIPFVGPSNFNGARLVGDYVLAKLPAGSKVAIIEGIPDTINAKSRSDGFRKSIANARMTLAGMRWGYWVADRAYTAARELLAATPDLAAILCGNDNMAIGAVAALEEKHLAGKVLVGGYDNIPAITPYLANGQMTATADQHPALQIQMALDLVLDAWQRHLGQEDLRAIVQTPVELIKKA